MPPSSSSISSRPIRQLQISEDEDLDDYARALESLRRQRAHAQAKKSREEATRRQMVAEQIVSEGLEGEAAFKLMGNQGTGANHASATPISKVKQRPVAESSSDAVLSKIVCEVANPTVHDQEYPADKFLGTGPQAIVLVLDHEHAVAMKKAVEARPGTAVIQTWRVNDEKTLVAYSDFASDWNDISSIATVKVMGRPGARIAFVAVVLCMAGFIGGLATYTATEFVTREMIHTILCGDIRPLIAIVKGFAMTLRLHASLALRRRFQSTLALLLEVLETMRDGWNEPPTIGF